MNSPQIIFSKKYNKLHNQTKARLVYMTVVDSSSLSEELIEYDTTATDGTKYALPKGKLIYLLFLGNKMIPFCTLRRWVKAKEEYYRRMLHFDFRVVIKNG